MDELPEPHSQQTHLATVVLAAGMGTRMRSRIPKVLHRIGGDPIIFHVLRAARGAGVASTVLVVGHGRDHVVAALGDSVRYVVQEPQLGTGHALQQALRVLDPIPARVLVLSGDTPLITDSTIRCMVSDLGSAALTLVSASVADPHGYGRVMRDGSGRVTAIVEEADAGPSERAVREINSGLYCFDGVWLAGSLDRIEISSKGEYYLTDLVALAVAQGREVRALLAEDPAEVMGVNDRLQLAAADRVLRMRVCEKLMSSGVTILDPDTTYIGADVAVGADTVIQPGTHLRGKTSIGERCEIGPNTIVVDSRIGDDCTVLASMLEQCEVEDRVSIGPFSHLRPGARIASGARIGNYAEVKNSSVGEGVQMHHFGYLGDAEVGAETNIGAGTITCNFTVRHEKHRTRIGKRAFIGSDTLLRAPVEVGDDAVTAAGSVVTRNVPPGKVAIGMPARVRSGGDRPDTARPKERRKEGEERGG